MPKGELARVDVRAGKQDKRPYSDADAETILAALRSGSGIREACKAAGRSWQVVFRWLRDPDRGEFAAGWEAAMQARADFLVDEALGIADGVREQPAAIAKAGLRVGVRKWIASRHHRTRYGDRLTVGGDPHAPITFQLARARVLRRLDELGAGPNITEIGATAGELVD